MAVIAFRAAVLLSLLVSASACSAPHGGCKADVCSTFAGVSVATVSIPGADYSNPATWLTHDLPKIGYYLGDYNKQINGGGYDKAGVAGTPALNLERFDLEDGKNDPHTGLPYASPSSEQDMVSCCNKCAATDGCYLWQFFPAETDPAYSKGTACWLLSGGSSTWSFPERGTPFAGSHRKQITSRALIPLSFVGGRCNGTSGVHDDPHFTGARGTRFDFNGDLDRSYCLHTDRGLHVNALLRGYMSNSTQGAVVGKDTTHNLRTWIREVAILWKDMQGRTHSLHLVARSGTQQERGSGFIAKAAVDSKPFPVPDMAGSGIKRYGLSFTFVGTFRDGRRPEVDHYRVRLGKGLDLSISVRVAHKSLQASDEAEAHFNLVFDELATTDAVHGVLGQTYRNTPKQVAKAALYTQLVNLLGEPVQADGKTGKGFLDGTKEDYVSSHILKPDCKFSSFL